VVNQSTHHSDQHPDLGPVRLPCHLLRNAVVAVRCLDETSRDLRREKALCPFSSLKTASIAPRNSILQFVKVIAFGLSANILAF
jgi:hypothetical protein